MTSPRLPNVPPSTVELAPHQTQPDPADRLAPREQVTVNDDELQRIILRVDRHQGHGVSAREVQKLAEAVKKYAPLTFAPPSALPSITSQPGCPGCGTAVEARGQLCPMCASKQTAKPVPLFETAPQPKPAYQREHEPEGSP